MTLPDSALGTPILMVTPWLLSPSKNLELQYSTLWPYCPILWVLSYLYSCYTCCLPSQSVPVSCCLFIYLVFFNQQCFSFPAKPTSPDGLSEHSSVCLPCISMFLPHCSGKSKLWTHCSSLPSPTVCPSATHWPKSQAALGVGSSAYSWLQNSFEPLAPPTKPLTCPWSAPSCNLCDNYSKCLPFCFYPLDSFLSVDNLFLSFINETEVMKCHLPHLLSSISVLIHSFHPQRM